MRGNRTTFAAAAFTLIELILVMVILAFVVAMVAPSLRGFGTGRRIHDTAALIVSLADYARTQAVNEGRAYRLNVEPRTGEFWLTVDADAGFQPPPNDFGRRFTASDGVTLRCDVKTRTDGQFLVFLPTGRTDPARIELNDTLGKRVVIACPSPTEMVRILTPEEAAR